ncbi:MAG: polysaccharide biosynthesis/export family protein [candidate division KSB1 bacterium]|nr:polysaccharide biosynthesis/export family protein [candidate division KSB1 bacterium]
MQVPKESARFMILLICSVHLCLGLSSLSAQSKSASSESLSRRVHELSYKVGDFAPGDGVRINVWRDPSFAGRDGAHDLGLNGDFIIDNKGYIQLPVIGEIRAVGQSRKNLARAIEDSLRIRAWAMQAICTPLIRVTLLGAVNRPGSYLIEPKDSLWGLINQAGGPANHADVQRIYVQRSGKKVIRNLLDGFEQAHSLEQIGVRSGDQIYVPGVSKITFRTVVDFVTLGASLTLLYLQISDYGRR